MVGVINGVGGKERGGRERERKCVRERERKIVVVCSAGIISLPLFRRNYNIYRNFM